MKHILFIICLVSIFYSCKKTDAPKPIAMPEPVSLVDTTGTLDIEISNVVNGQPLVLSSVSYTNANADTFKVNMLKYYFTNVQLSSANGYTFAEVESYYLINQANASTLHLHIKKVPRANYNHIQFLIGVDNHRNTAGAQTGALDPINDMFWSWNQGYIMAKFEGTSNQSGDANGHLLTFHLGGFSGAYSSVRMVNFNFPNTANVTETHTPIVNMQADIAQWFKSPNITDFSSDYVITSSGTRSKSMADNYADMFTITSVVN